MNLVNLKQVPVDNDQGGRAFDRQATEKAPHVHPTKVPQPRDNASGQGMSESTSNPGAARLTSPPTSSDEVKSKDCGWEDGIDNPYQQCPIPYTLKAFRWISTEDRSRSSPDPEDKHQPKPPARGFQLRYILGSPFRYTLARANSVDMAGTLEVRRGRLSGPWSRWSGS